MSLLGAPMSDLEIRILRNVVDGQRTRDIAVGERAAHDRALIDLVKRGLVEYNENRPKRFRFMLSIAGELALERAERMQETAVRG